jgi:hypothetical protein
VKRKEKKTQRKKERRCPGRQKTKGVGDDEAVHGVDANDIKE